MKTTEEWFNELKIEYRERALKNMINPKAEHYSLAGAVSNGFVWDDSTEGKDYWNGVFREVMYGENFDPTTFKKHHVPKKTSETIKKEKVQEVKSEDVIKSSVKLVQQENKETKKSDSTNEDNFKSENLYEQYKVETDIQPENSLPNTEGDNLLNQNKLEKENTK